MTNHHDLHVAITINHLLLLACWTILLGGIFIACFTNKISLIIFAVLFPPIRYLAFPILPKKKSEYIYNQIDRLVPFSLAIVFITRTTKVRIMRVIYITFGIFLLILLLTYNGYVTLVLDTKYFNLGTPIIYNHYFDDDIVKFSNEHDLLPKEMQTLQNLRDSNTEFGKRQFQKDIDYFQKLDESNELSFLGLKLNLNHVHPLNNSH